MLKLQRHKWAISHRQFWFLTVAGLIVILATFARIFHLGQVPIELTRDEAALGYTAYSILETGRDEYGRWLPVAIESFGDWKLPGYVYALIPLVKLWGLDTWSVRLLSAWAGVALVIGAMILIWSLGRAWQRSARIVITLLTGGLIAISPWNIHLSHLAYEANLGLAFMTWGLAVMSFGHLQSAKKKDLWVQLRFDLRLVLGALLLGLSTITYHAFQLVVPLLVVNYGWLNRARWTKLEDQARQRLIIILTIIFLPMLLFIITGGVAGNQTKLSGLSILDGTVYKSRAEQLQPWLVQLPKPFKLVYTNQLVQFVDQVQRNLSQVLSLDYWFFSGGGHGSHDIAGTGKLYPIQLPFILLALWGSWQKKSQWSDQFQVVTRLMLVWLGISLLPALITFQAAHSIRLIAAQVPLTVLTAIGVWDFWQILVHQTRLRLVLSLVATICLVFSFFHFWVTYFYVAPIRDADHWHWQIRPALFAIDQVADDYSQVVISGSSWSPYIYYLFYSRFDPHLAQSQITHYPINEEGFRHVSSIGKYQFVDQIEWNQLESTMTRILYLVPANIFPQDKKSNDRYTVLQTFHQSAAEFDWLLISLDV